jgi:hypothetical protein
MNRSCQRQTHGLETPARCMISAVPQPSAVARMDLRPPDMFADCSDPPQPRPIARGPQHAVNQLSSMLSAYCHLIYNPEVLITTAIEIFFDHLEDAKRTDSKGQHHKMNTVSKWCMPDHTNEVSILSCKIRPTTFTRITLLDKTRCELRRFA